jgi:acyl carrier protein
MTQINEQEDLRSRLSRVFQDVFSDDTLKIADEMTAEDIEGWDSLKHITLVVAIEAEFGVRFSATEMGELDSVSSILDALRKSLIQQGDTKCL